MHGVVRGTRAERRPNERVTAPNKCTTASASKGLAEEIRLFRVESRLAEEFRFFRVEVHGEEEVLEQRHHLDVG